MSGASVPAQISETLSRKSPFTLSWSHYVELLGIKDPEERSFYEVESANSGWNVRELKRQKASALYLPSKKMLKAKLIEWAQEEESRR
jgi:predicted nuclease of restriction endonuclease-like (RecB) superfamily